MNSSKPPAKRQRVPLACKHCRKLKVKCSGDFPCVKCKKLGIPCSFSTDLKEPPREPVIMEPKMANLNEHDPIGYVIGWRIYARTQLLLIRELCQTNLDLLPPEKRTGLKVPRMHNYGWNMSGMRYLQPPKFPAVPDHDFTGEHLDLLRYFFNEINPLYLVLPREFLAFFTKSYSNFMCAAAHPSLRHKTDVNLHMATLYLVFALAIRFTEFSRVQGPRMEMLKVETACYTYAHEVVETITAEYFSLELLQAWMLVAIYLRTAYNQRALLRALDLANCMARTMGLHERRVLYSKPEATKKKAIHAFWTVYTLDEMFSVQIGRPSFWRNEEISVPKPDEDEFWSTSKTALDQYAMFKIALVAHDVQHVRWHPDGDMDAVAKKIESLHTWLVGMGFLERLNGMMFEQLDTISLSTDCDTGNQTPSGCLYKAQVALHFYDVVFAFHSPVLLGLVGKPASSRGLDPQIVLQYMCEVILLTQGTIKSGNARVPWYNTLIVLFGVGTYALILANSALHGDRPRRMYMATIEVLRIIGAYKNSEGVPLYHMANECVWALTQGLHSMRGRFEHEAQLIREIDTGDHTGYLNEHNFGLMGRFQEYLRDELPKLEEYSTGENRSEMRRDDQDNEHDEKNDNDDKNKTEKNNDTREENGASENNNALSGDDGSGHVYRNATGKNGYNGNGELTDLMSVDEMVRQLTCGTWLDAVDLLDADVMNFVDYENSNGN